MKKIRIVGGNPLEGKVEIAGAKNAALPCLAASLLTNEPITLHNIPQVGDVSTMLKLLSHLGSSATFASPGTFQISLPKVKSYIAPYEMVKTMRASVLVLGPLLSRHGYALVSLPGGCAIGARPIDLHLEGLRKLGARIELKHGFVEASCQRLKGAEIYMDTVTVTGTENLMMASVLADGITVLKNCALEPEVTDLANLLVQMGAEIEGIGTSILKVRGVDRLHSADHTIIPDRIEAGTYLIAGAISGGELEVKGCNHHHLVALTDKLLQAGVNLSVEGDSIWVRGGDKLGPVDIKTSPYPGFPTDMQAQFMTLMTQAEGVSIITETIFENRFLHVAELDRMGAHIKIDNHSAVIMGGTGLSGARVMATDLRASASLIIGGLVASGETVVERVYHLDRGYEKIEEKLKKVGAQIERIDDD